MPCKLADFYNETRGARKIIVIDLGYLGDSIHLLPALREIRENYLAAELHVASAPIGSELLAMSPAVTRTWPLARSPGGTPWRAQWRWIRAIRRERFDLVFNFSGTDRTIFLAFLTGARWRVAFAGGRQHFWNSWLIRHWVPRLDRTMHVAEQRRQVLAACGLQIGQLRYPLEIPASARSWAEQTVPANAIHLSINAGHALKEWPVLRWTALARHLLERMPGVHLVATGTNSPREQSRLNQFAQSVTSPRLKIFAGDLSLAQLAALLARCQLHVGADSGALHLAAVLGVRTVSIFRDYEGIGEWMPRGPQHRSVVAPCRCVNRKVQPCAAQGEPDCLAGITLETVLRLIEEA